MGDVISVLYTNSPAMHSSLMREYSPNVAAPRSNAFIVRCLRRCTFPYVVRLYDY